MAGNRKNFDKGMKKAAHHAWSKSWAKAIKEYKWALTEFPEDTGGLVGLGIAYAESGQLEPALELFQKLIATMPEDPIVLSRLAEVQERLGQSSQAAELLVNLASIYEKQGALDRAAEALARAVRLAPELDEAHRKLARTYVDLGQPEKAAAVHVALARVLQANGRLREAIQSLRVASGLDPRNEEVRSLLEAIRADKGVDLGSELGDGGPVEVARHSAWSELAQVLFEDLTPETMSDTDMVPTEQRLPPQKVDPAFLDRAEVKATLGRGVDLDTKNDISGAIRAYQQVLKKGLDRVAVHFALGLLYKSEDQLEEACRHLAITTFHPDYALAAHLALGDSYQLHRRLDLAVQHFIQALKVADLQTVDETRAMEVSALYGSLTDGYRYEGQRGREHLIVDFIHSVKDFFRDRNWLTRAVQLREHLDTLSVDGVTMSLAEGLGVPGFDEILQALSEVQQLVNRGMLVTAREECYRAVERAPGYLPLHLRLADIFVREGRVDDAVSKYMIVAEVYEVWRDYAQAINVFRLILSMTPLDVKVRSKLIDLLISRREIEQALEQYLALADAYYQLARVDKALEKFNEALRLTDRSQSERAWRLKILYFMGDLHAQRVDWAKAAEVYEEILRMAPEEDQAGLYLMDLHFKQARPEQAMAELQRILRRYDSGKQPEAFLRVLKEAARLRPNEMSIRARLSQAYMEADQKQEAIAELDALGEMQLEAGLRDQAIQTIRLIISLKPANVRAYKQLLYHLLS